MFKKYKKIFLLWVFVLGFFPFASNAAPIIIDHTAVDKFNGDIPDQYIVAAKKMWLNFPGESHGTAYPRGASLLYQQTQSQFGDKYKAVEQSAYIEDALRTSGTPGSGEAKWYTWYAADPNQTSAIKTHILNSYNSNLRLSAIGFGWCWDTTWNGTGWISIKDISDPVYKVNWSGASEGGPDGNTRWGLDAADFELTGNRVSMDTYLQATQAYADYAQAYGTKVVFTTGPVDGQDNGNGYATEKGYQRYLKHEHIRNYVKANENRILFDYADILSYNNSGSPYKLYWNDDAGVRQELLNIHPDNMKDLNGSYVEDGDHIGQIGAIRLAKGMWVLAVMLAGWDGSNGGTQPCLSFSYSAWGTCQGGIQTRTATGNPIGCVGGVSPEALSRSCYTLGGSITGLEAGNSVSLQNNGENLVRTSNGNFVFANTLINGDSYNVIVSTQPTGKFCYVENGSGNVSANITNVIVSCCKIGDTDCSGTVNVQDIQNVIRVVLRLETDQAKIARANANGDGTVNIQDVQEIIRIVLAG